MLKGAGKVSINTGCTGYSLTTLLNTKNQVQVNTSKPGDLLSKLDAQFECCDKLGTSVNLSHIELDMKLKHVVSHLEELKYASYKISEIENLATDQE
jgi:hypothetical protein